MKSFRSLQYSSAGVVQSLFSVNCAEPPIPYAEVILDIGSVRGFKRKTMVQSNSKRTKCYLWLVCNREVWAPGTTDENSFLIRSLTDAFSIHCQAFNGFESS